MPATNNQEAINEPKTCRICSERLTEEDSKTLVICSICEHASFDYTDEDLAEDYEALELHEVTGNVVQFPKIINELDKCAGCRKPLTDSYYQVELPMSPGTIKHIGLCESCHADAEAIGIFG